MSRLKLYISLLLIANILCVVEAYGTGSPRTDSVCRHKIPGHHVLPQTSPPPYKITVTPMPENGNDVIQVTVEAEDYFRGVLLQLTTVRKEDDVFRQEVIGEFFGTTETRLLNCFHESDSFTHSRKSKKQKLTVSAKITTPDAVENFIANATVVREFNEFWTNVTSDVVPHKGKPKDSIPWKWLKITSSAAKAMGQGQKAWDKSIKKRLRSGWGPLLKDGLIHSRQIKDTLPFTLLERPTGSKGLGAFKSYRSGQYSDRKKLSNREIVSEFLKGDIRFAEDVALIVEV